MRKQVEELIGTEAEMLIWLFCMMERDTFDANLRRQIDFRVRHRQNGEWIALRSGQYFDLVNLTFANTLEAYPHLSLRLRRACRNYLLPFHDIATNSTRV